MSTRDKSVPRPSPRALPKEPLAPGAVRDPTGYQQIAKPTRQKKPIDYWEQTAMAKRRTRLREKMEGGDTDAGRKLLATSVGVLAQVINGEPVTKAHVEVLDYIRTAIQYSLDGQRMELAFGIEAKQGGRPRRKAYDDLAIYGMVKEKAEKLKREGCAAPIELAIKAVARLKDLTPRTVRGIWNNKKKE
jgi:hypothetical protein